MAIFVSILIIIAAVPLSLQTYREITASRYAIDDSYDGNEHQAFYTGTFKGNVKREIEKVQKSNARYIRLVDIYKTDLDKAFGPNWRIVGCRDAPSFNCDIEFQPHPYVTICNGKVLFDGVDRLYVIEYSQPTGERREFKIWLNKDTENLDQAISHELQSVFHDRLENLPFLPKATSFAIRNDDNGAEYINFYGVPSSYTGELRWSNQIDQSVKLRDIVNVNQPLSSVIEKINLIYFVYTELNTQEQVVDTVDELVLSAYQETAISNIDVSVAIGYSATPNPAEYVGNRMKILFHKLELNYLNGKRI